MALASKIEHLRAAGPLAEYRFYLARRSALLNVPPEEWDLKGILALTKKVITWAMKKGTLVVQGLQGIVLPSYVGIFYIKQPVEWKVRGFFSWLTWRFDPPVQRKGSNWRKSTMYRCIPFFGKRGIPGQLCSKNERHGLFLKECCDSFTLKNFA